MLGVQIVTAYLVRFLKVDLVKSLFESGSSCTQCYLVMNGASNKTGVEIMIERNKNIYEYNRIYGYKKRSINTTDIFLL